MPQWRTLYLTQHTVMTDGKGWTRLALPPSDLADLLNRVAQAAPSTGTTLILGNGAHVNYGLPERMPTRGDTTQLPAFGIARAAGWNISDLSPWMTFWRPNTPTVHVGVRPWLKPGNFALHTEDPMVEQWRMSQFYNALGTPYHGTNPGLAGIDLLRDQHKGRVPLWMPSNWARVAPAGMTVETVDDQWRTELPDHGLPFEHAFDLRMQFLAAAMNAKVAADALRWHHGDQVTLEPGAVQPGYYLVTVPSWAYRDRIPHPMGHKRQYDERAWVTSATLELVLELADRDNVMAVPEIHEAWIAPGGPLLRPWATKIRDAEAQVRKLTDVALHTAIKGVYKAGLGLLNRKGQARVFRPDWHQIVVGMARSNFWRKIWREGRTSGRWPVEIHADAVWYPSKDQNPEWPATFRQGEGLGCFRHEDTRVVMPR